MGEALGFADELDLPYRPRQPVNTNRHGRNNAPAGGDSTGTADRRDLGSPVSLAYCLQRTTVLLVDWHRDGVHDRRQIQASGLLHAGTRYIERQRS